MFERFLTRLMPYKVEGISLAEDTPVLRRVNYFFRAKSCHEFAFWLDAEGLSTVRVSCGGYPTDWRTL